MFSFKSFINAFRFLNYLVFRNTVFQKCFKRFCVVTSGSRPPDSWGVTGGIRATGYKLLKLEYRNYSYQCSRGEYCVTSYIEVL